MSKGLVIIGAGGFGREVLDVVEAVETAGETLDFQGFLDDGPVKIDLLERRGAQLLGPVSEFASFASHYVIGIGDTHVRSKIAEKVEVMGGAAVTVAHPLSSLGSDVNIAEGVVITAGVRITTHVRIGRHTHINLNSTIGHDAVIGDFVSIFPGVTISGDVSIGDFVTIGTGANIINGVSIGEGSYVGAGAVVTGDVPPMTMVVGVPARPVVR